jgi:hypothetical protein
MDGIGRVITSSAVRPRTGPPAGPHASSVTPGDGPDSSPAGPAGSVRRRRAPSPRPSHRSRTVPRRVPRPGCGSTRTRMPAGVIRLRRRQAPFALASVSRLSRSPFRDRASSGIGRFGRRVVVWLCGAFWSGGGVGVEGVDLGQDAVGCFVEEEVSGAGDDGGGGVGAASWTVGRNMSARPNAESASAWLHDPRRLWIR